MTFGLSALNDIEWQRTPKECLITGAFAIKRPTGAFAIQRAKANACHSASATSDCHFAALFKELILLVACVGWRNGILTLNLLPRYRADKLVRLVNLDIRIVMHTTQELAHDR